MRARRLHPDEFLTDVRLVRRMVAARFPEWANLPIAAVESAGSDHALYRLGDELVLRLPGREHVADQADKEQEWLPRLAPYLPCAIPAQLVQCEPIAGFPFRWSVYGWLPGENPPWGRCEHEDGLARDLAAFVRALGEIDPRGGTAAGTQNFGRGAPLATRDEATRTAIAELGDSVDVEAVTAAWASALSTPAWTGSPVWVHGDLTPENMLVEDGRLSAVIDWGCLGVGDPAVDLMLAWDLLSAEGRAVFRDEVAVDEATWSRGRGWALSTGLIALPYYADTNPIRAENARYRIAEVLSEHPGG